ncbi:MFS transporter [Planococcus shenhongbingii]|uniref:MFS transporter n=1 Tax=Planococcus shenhongbingii TaxID=3058398 RepID=A0ABT8NBA2_9BACL|nr:MULTISPECIES: MFS transporter [unclassified Planococcus (in: firmicutes)]MDN7245173.1 MFS transporter [Planococcus sp. N017]WKA58276.1 MFS transporter [Planococcus sp. N016]
MTSSVQPQNEKMDKAKYKIFFGAYIGWIFDYYEIFVLSFLVIPMAAALDLSTAQVAAVFSVQLAFLAVGGVVFGYLGDRIGRKKILIATLVIFCLATLMRGFTFDYEWLIFWTAIAGFGLGGEYGAAQALVSESVPSRQRGFWSSMLYGGAYMGIFLGATVGGFILPLIGWRMTFIISALPILFALWLRRDVEESKVWEADVKKQKSLEKVDWRKKYGLRRFWKPFTIALIAAVLQYFAYYGITNFLPTYLVKYEGFEMGAAGWWLFFTAFAGLVGSFIAGYTTDKWGRKITLSYLAFVAALGGLALYFTWASLINSLWILVPIFFLYFGSNGASVFGSLFSEIFPTDVRATGISWALQIGRGLSAFPPLITAAVFPVYGYQPIILGGAGLFMLLAMWAWVFPETKNRRLDHLDDVTKTAKDPAENPELQPETSAP